MKTRILWFLAMLPLFVACNNGSDSTPIDTQSSGRATVHQPTRPQLVRMADGTFVTHAFLVQNSDQIASLMASNPAEATAFIKENGDVQGSHYSAADRARACAPNLYLPITDIGMSAYYYPPTFQNNNNINISFNNFFFGNNFGFNGGQALGYYGNYNQYPPGYQPWNNGSPYPYNPFGNFYGNYPGFNPQGFGNYYNPPPNGEFCNGLINNPQFGFGGSTYVNPGTYGTYSNSCFFHTQFGGY